MVATVATCKGVQHGATIYHKCHCYMVLHCLLHRCHRKPLLVFALNNGRIFPHPGGQAVNVHGPHSSIYQSISVSISIYVFFFKCIALYFVGLKVTTLSPISAMVLPVRALSKRASTRRPKKQVCRMKA